MSEPEDRETAAGLSGPPYVQQPEDAERPMPLRGIPERTQDTEDWDAGRGEPLAPRPPDQVADLTRQRRDEERRARADGTPEAPPARSDDESAYSTENVQGAAQPGPDES